MTVSGIDGVVSPETPGAARKDPNQAYARVKRNGHLTTEIEQAVVILLGNGFTTQGVNASQTLHKRPPEHPQ